MVHEEKDLKRIRLETQTLVIGYAMSRLNHGYLQARNATSWQAAFAEAATQLHHPPNTFKNLRDEYDPIHSNPRRGRVSRPLRPSRQRIIDELVEVSDDALNEMVRHILRGNEEELIEALDTLTVVTKKPANVAERLLTGRKAEEFFLSHCDSLMGFTPSQILDRRDHACGFDFSISGKEEIGIEVKGLKQNTGQIMFTDKEWHQASIRRENYILIVVGNLATVPSARIFPDPYESIPAYLALETRLIPTWRATVSLLG